MPELQDDPASYVCLTCGAEYNIELCGAVGSIRRKPATEEEQI